jgi:hypothetical protein
MALIVSAASGNFNAGATWVGGVVPGVGDEAQAATGHTITITADATCNEISNAGTGKFVLSDGVTLTANVTHKGATATTNCLEFSSVSPAEASIIGNCEGGTLISTQRGAVNLSTGTLNITGNCKGGAGNFNYGALNNTTGTIQITGECIGGSGPSAEPAGVSNSSTGTVNITGNCTAGTGGQAYGAINRSTGALNITGNCTAGTAAGAFQFSTGTLSIIGTVTASQASPGVAGANVSQVTILSGPFITETTRGVNPVYCAAWRWNTSPSNSTYLEVMTNNLLTKRNLVTPDNATNLPTASDVRSGTAYGIGGVVTGTCVVPNPAQVAAGTLVDDTVGTLASATAGEIATAIWSHSSRTITGGTVDTLTNAPTVPTAAAIAEEVRVELATELARIDAPISGAGNDITAIKGKTDLLNTDRLAQCSTVATTGAQLAAALS